MMERFPAITGATPIYDASGLKLPILTWRELTETEAANIAKAIAKYLAKKPSRRTAPFDTEWSLKLHREMFGEVWDWAGTLRTTQPNIGVPAHRIREELHKLFDDLRYWEKSGMELLEQAARLHHRAVWIHPFPNGNGRWARMLSDIWLKQNGSGPTHWPADVGRESSIRKEYIAALQAADQGDIVPLLRLQRTYALSPGGG